MDGTWVKTLGNVLGQGGPDGVMLGEAEYDQCIKRIIIDIKNSQASVLDVLRPLGGYLTSGDNVPRCRAISFLAEVGGWSIEQTFVVVYVCPFVIK